jgi:D-Tyr-tRNAtyr deacylase
MLSAVCYIIPMRAVVQRVTRCRVTVEGSVAGEIGAGLLVLLGVSKTDAAARPEEAKRLYEYFVGKVRAAGLRCETGQFQAMMEVELVNSGPVTILLDSERVF